MDTRFSIEGEELPTERRLPFWQRVGGGALTFAILFHVILLIIGAIWIFQTVIIPQKNAVDFLPGGDGGGGERAAQTKVQQKKRAQITPSTNVKRVFAEGAKSTYSLPEPGETFGEMSPLTSLASGGLSGGLGGKGTGTGFGNGSGSGSGFGAGSGAGKFFGLIPEALKKRCSKDDRAARLRENGGTPACEDAVLKGLRWIKSQQKANGSWGKSNKPAMTGLALLAYLGHCETVVSPEFGESAAKGITYLIDLGMKNNGKLATNSNTQPFCYEHAIATYALAEAATLCKETKWPHLKDLEAITQKAGQYIIDNQHQSGGWAYQYAINDGRADVSIVGWQIQALKACSHVTNIKLNGMDDSIARALKFVNSCQNSDGGYGYTKTGTGNHGGYHPLTGVGMLCNQMWGKDKGPEVRKAADYVLAKSKFDYNTPFADLYCHYYESQAMIQRGGAEWKKYNHMFRDQLLDNQNADGSWKAPGGGNKIRGGPSTYVSNELYRTTLCILMLEVYYRFLSTGGGGTHKGRAGLSGI
jgi:hypothetical protein